MYMDSSSGIDEASKTEKTTTLSLEEEEEEEEEDDVAWEMLNKSFKEVQKALDKNRLLIQQVNQNHQSKIHDNLVKNVELIQEINANISKVSRVYSTLSVDFSSYIQKTKRSEKQHK